MQNKTGKNRSQILWEEFDKKMRKIRLIASGVIVLLLVCAGGLMFLLSQNTGKKTQTAKPTIALVDEDQAATFNGTNYNFGQSFVNLVSNDNKYNWQVVSRSVANKAYADGSVQAVIYLPQDFTHNILTLQALDPQKAQVDYKVLNSQSELTNNLLQDKIVNVLYDFNSSIVKMYYASVAGNVANAQTNMGNVVNSQGAILTNLKNNVYGPFQTTNDSYSSVISMANSLKSQNDSWIQAQNSFTTGVTGMLNANSSSFSNTLPSLTNYFNTQKQIADINLANSNQGITNQAKSDESAYYAQYTAAYNKAVQTMQQFDSTDASGNETGLYANLKNQIGTYNTLISGVRDDIGTQITNLSDKQTTLLALEKKLYSQFFAQDVNPTADNTDFTSLTTGDAGTTNARQALANLLATSFGKTDNISGTAYPNTISNLLSQLSVDSNQYEPLLTALVDNGSLTSAQKLQYENELGVLNNYATDFNLHTASVDFSAAPTANTTDQTFTKQLKITVPAGKVYTLSLNASNGIANNNVSISSAIDQNGTALTINNPNSIILDNTRTPSTDANGNPTTVPATNPMTYTINYHVDLGQATSGTVTASWNNESGSSNSSVDTFGLIPANSISEYAGGSQFGYITTLLNNINTASSLIAFLYGNPGATYVDMEGVTDFTGTGNANAQSIYSMYGNMDKSQIATRLSDDDVNQFMTDGVNNIKDVTDTLGTLQSTLASLTTDQTTLTNNLPTDYFAQISSDLNTWYNQTMTTLNAEYQAWTTNQTNLLQEKPWQEYNQSDVALYYDKADSDSMYSTISGMVSSTAKQAKDTASSAQIIKSNAEQFNQMVNTVTQTQNAAKKVIDNTNSLLSSGNGDFKNSQNYYGNFESVLSNTRTNGVNANNIFDFFAKPLSTKDITPQVHSVTQGFDWRWILIFIIGLLFGVLGKTWIRRKPKNEEQ